MNQIGSPWYNGTMETVLQRQRQSGSVKVETTVRVVPFCEGFFVEQTALTRWSGALVRTDNCSWHLDDDQARRELVRKLEGNGFQVTEGTPLIERVVDAVLGWL